MSKMYDFIGILFSRSKAMLSKTRSAMHDHGWNYVIDGVLKRRTAPSYRQVQIPVSLEGFFASFVATI